MSAPRLLRVAEAAAILRCSEPALRQRMMRGAIPASLIRRLGPKSIRFDADALEQWITDSTPTEAKP